PAEEAGRRPADVVADGHGEALVTPGRRRPLQRMRPPVGHVGAGDTVVEAVVLLTPLPLEAEPRVRAEAGGASARHPFHVGQNVAAGTGGAVPADALGRASAEVQSGGEVVRVGAKGGVHDRMRAVDELEPRLAPARALGALVLAVADRRRPLPECLLRAGGG